LDELVAGVAGTEIGQLEKRHPDPVLLIARDSEEWEEHTTVDTDENVEPASVSMRLPSVVFAIRPKPLNTAAQRVTLGRSSVCDVVLPFAAVSKVHAYLSKLGPHLWQIEDAGSTNGTSVDGAEVKQNRRAPLRDGSMISLGKVKARFLLPVSFCAELRSRAGVL
jgi:hypothetical protein